MNIWASLSRNTRARGEFSSSSRTNEDRKIEGVALLVRREKDGKKIFKYWTCNEFGHYASKCPKKEKIIRSLIPEDLEIICMQMKMRNLMKELKVKVMMR